jgi:UDP-N-acetylglucosamine 2-epimerase (non-hydrolysing)
VIGTSRNDIVATTRTVLRDGVEATAELWDGHAGERIAEVIMTGATTPHRKRPTDL